MRNLPAVTEILPESKATAEPGKSIDLKKWLTFANDDDLYALCSEEIANKTGYRFHDLLFNLYYEDRTARRFRDGIMQNFRALISGATTIHDIKAITVP